MPVTTALDDSQLNIPTGNRKVDKLLDVIKANTNVDFQVVVTTHYKSSILGRRLQPSFQIVQIYRYVGGMFPWYVVNEAYDYPTIIAYLEGFVEGVYEGGNESKV